MITVAAFQKVYQPGHDEIVTAVDPTLSNVGCAVNVADSTLRF